MNTLSSRIQLVRNESTKEPLTKHITPGLSSLKDNPSKASDYMEPIMEFLNNSIPQERHLDTSIHFMATAGMRLLDDVTQRKIMSDLTNDLSSKYNFPKMRTQVISGEYEGIYSWLSLNMNKKLYNQSSAGEPGSYGMIEMGGASAQVTFELEPEIENNILENLRGSHAIAAFQNEHRTLNLGPKNSVKLFTTTFLGLGVNSARGSAIDLLVLNYMSLTHEKPKANELRKFQVRLKDPCLTNGSSEIVLRPISLLDKSDGTIGLEIQSKDDTFTVRLEGEGDFFECKNLLERTLKTIKDKKLNCPQNSATCPMSLLGTNFIPYQHYPFIGLSEMYFTTNEMMNSAGPFKRTKVLHETKRICSSKYNDLLELYSTSGLVTYHDRILYECFKASWLLVVLHNYGFNMPEEYENFTTLDRLDGEEIDWTIGAMVTEVALSSAFVK